MWITSSLSTAKTPTLAALGNFDGIHLGHQRVIEPIFHPADLRLRSAADFLWPTVVTFDPHPQEFFSGQRRTLLTPLPEKATYLEALGVKQLVLLPFDQSLANLTPEQFVEQILKQQLQARLVSVGQNFRFGYKRSGTTEDLKTIATQSHIEVHLASLYTHEGDRISSSAIRQALAEGQPQQASALLGRPYALMGEIVSGQQLGRTLGFPTANLSLPPEKFLPRKGVYSVWVEGVRGESRSLPGVMNLGDRPTVSGTQLTVEVHLLDWSGDLYGQTLTVHLSQFLRPEQRFNSLDELKAQIQTDCEQARVQLTATSKG
ncbi:MAG: bifunctional riboflavin kinase/FAD synthetase [Oculatellaceae cyanobacterium Prado106]|nr:bifunctional riboflavin kinase/FAD synthetase [Oculatellaceae cyanobacterium Prado106]